MKPTVVVRIFDNYWVGIGTELIINTIIQWWNRPRVASNCVIFVRIRNKDASNGSNNTLDNAFEWITFSVVWLLIIWIVANVWVVLTKAKYSKRGECAYLFFALVTQLLESHEFDELVCILFVDQKGLNSCLYLQVLTQMLLQMVIIEWDVPVGVL